MSRIILNSQILQELDITTNIKFQRGDGKNYFFVPTIALKLYNPKVAWIDPLKKNISFSFNKYENLTLLKMLKSINDKLIYIYNNKSDEPVLTSPFFYEKDDLFYIRCYLPNCNKLKGKYFIESIFNGQTEKFNIPLVNCVYSSIIVDIRNIWEDPSRSGFNLELKVTESNF